MRVCLFSVVMLFLAISPAMGAHAPVRLTGQLTKKYYAAPKTVKDPVFGWYLLLDDQSEQRVKDRFSELSAEDQRILNNTNFNYAHLQLWQEDLLGKCRSAGDSVVNVDGQLSEPYLNHYEYRCFVVDVNSIKAAEVISEPEVSITGSLRLKLYPGPPEFSCIERGDRADYIWIGEVDEETLTRLAAIPVPELGNTIDYIMQRPNRREITLLLDDNNLEFCNESVDTKITVKGKLFHAHTAHHHTPLLLDVQEVER